VFDRDPAVRQKQSVSGVCSLRSDAQVNQMGRAWSGRLSGAAALEYNANAGCRHQLCWQVECGLEASVFKIEGHAVKRLIPSLHYAGASGPWKWSRNRVSFLGRLESLCNGYYMMLTQQLLMLYKYH